MATRSASGAPFGPRPGGDCWATPDGPVAPVAPRRPAPPGANADATGMDDSLANASPADTARRSAISCRYPCQIRYCLPVAATLTKVARSVSTAPPDASRPTRSTELSTRPPEPLTDGCEHMLQP